VIRELTPELEKELELKARKSRGDIVAMTFLAQSGHPGGSMSSIDIYTLLYNTVDLDRDKVVVSHGHTSPGVYSALARKGFFPPLDVVKGFRRVGSAFEGHVEPGVPGVPWGTGNLGQGLSVACGFAVAARVKGEPADIFVVMGDGEQQKGQISEARRFISKFGLSNITVIIDDNGLQISGSRHEVMPQDLRREYEGAGFVVLEVDGHDLKALHQAIRKAVGDVGAPYAVIAHTVMGKGVSFMENKADYHGRPLNKGEMEKALPELDLQWPLEDLIQLRKEPVCEYLPECSWPFPSLTAGTPRFYAKDVLTDNRSALGTALLQVAQANPGVPFAVFDCDLAGSVKTDGFMKAFPGNFFQAGISEHHTAAMAGAASTQGVVSVFADFGMFGIDETYNQQRLNAINGANLKLFCTHLGIDVGEDGKTHQCIDYLGLLRNLEGFSVVIPLDPNEADLAARWALSTPGNVMIGVGRSKTPVLTDLAGREIFKEGGFAYGRAHHLRTGSKGTLFALGAMSAAAVRVWEDLMAEGLDVEVVGVSCPLALDASEVRDAAARGPVFVAEDHLSVSGLAAGIAFLAATSGAAVDLVPMGVRGFPPSGPSDTCLKCFELHPEDLANRMKKRLKERV
jgi:transketolase